jgi:glyoxalase family protein
MHLTGIHHVTAVTADVQANVDFYCGVLGLRLTKVTVNFDDPHSYHLYYGDTLGRPGTAMTFFGWPGAGRGRHGPPEVFTTAFAVPRGALGYWQKRLGDAGVAVTGPVDAYGRADAIGFEDPDGLRLQLVETDALDAAIEPFTAVVGPEHAIRGFHDVSLAVLHRDASARALVDVFGFVAAPGNADAPLEGAAGVADGVGNQLDDEPDAEDDAPLYLSRPVEPAAAVARVWLLSDLPAGRFGGGVVHHVAFRCPSDAEQAAWLERITATGWSVSPVMERVYFRSIYVREPGGVLFEIATDGPGFTADEPAESLGTTLCLPPWMEKDRAGIEKNLPRLRLPGGAVVGGR